MSTCHFNIRHASFIWSGSKQIMQIHKNALPTFFLELQKKNICDVES